MSMFSAATPIRILICDDHAVVRRGLRAILTERHGMQVVGEATNGGEAITLAAALRPDVILMDMVMPGTSGLEAITAILGQDPDAHILVLTSFGEEDKRAAALRLGVRGYLLKDSSPEELLAGIRQAAGNGQPAQAGQVVLTEREKEVLRLVSDGLTNQEIANQLGISLSTARTHVSNLLAKLGLENRTQLALFAKGLG